jgi:hypothetical protein
MYLSQKAAFVRNAIAAGTNGAITLIILLIAPLGIVAVIVNTVLITLSTFFVCSVADMVVVWLSFASQPNRLDRSRKNKNSAIEYKQTSEEIDRQKWD